jgi:type II secretory pathway component GspD/PulD (secretin)
MKFTPYLTLLLILPFTGCQTADSDKVTGSVNFPKIGIEPLPEWVTAEKPEPKENARQIRVETKFVEVEHESIEEDTALAAMYVKNVNAENSLEELQKQESTDILSAPSITVLEDQLANITIAQELKYPELKDGNVVFNTVNIGLSSHLKVTSGDDPETLNIQLLADVTELDGFQEIMDGKWQFPVISNRRIDTNLTLKSGQTALVGGLVINKKIDVSDKLPLLGDIPILGALFTNQGTESRKRELIIMVTPTIVTQAGETK